jgi:nicotinate-nucleotide adenylyltransferase
MARLIGVLGGTFDPPHIGHLILADEAISALDLDLIFWVLTPDPPHKQSQNITPLGFRLRMVQETIKRSPAFQISNADIDRPAPHYSVGTMEWLREHYPDVKFFYLMGSDSLKNLPSWQAPQRFVDLCAGLGVMERDRLRPDLERMELEIPGIKDKTRYFDTPMVEVSGKDIRRRVREGRPYRYLVPHGVAEIIKRYDIYLDD